MATRYVQMGYPAAALNQKVREQVYANGFTEKPESGPPFRKIIDPDWSPEVSLMVQNDEWPCDLDPIPTKQQRRVDDYIKVTLWRDRYSSPVPELPKVWYKKLINFLVSGLTCDLIYLDYIVYITAIHDGHIIYYRSKWVEEA